MHCITEREKIDKRSREWKIIIEPMNSVPRHKVDLAFYTWHFRSVVLIKFLFIRSTSFKGDTYDSPNR